MMAKVDSPLAQVRDADKNEAAGAALECRVHEWVGLLRTVWRETRRPKTCGSPEMRFCDQLSEAQVIVSKGPAKIG